jgi:hypothetical protein
LKIYVIGSLRNPKIPDVGNALRAEGWEAFEDWFAGGDEADDKWKQYQERRGRSYSEALKGENARHIFEFDKADLDTSDVAVLVTPAGKSGHLELGYMTNMKNVPGKSHVKTYVYFDGEPDRWDVMYRFADNVFFSIEDLINGIRADMGPQVFGDGGDSGEVEQGPQYEMRGSDCCTESNYPGTWVQRFP